MVRLRAPILRSVRTLGPMVAVVAGALLAVLVLASLATASAPAFASTSTAPPRLIAQVAVNARREFAQRAPDWAKYVVSSADDVANALGVRISPPPAEGARVYVVIMKGSFRSEGASGSYLAFTTWQLGDRGEAANFTISQSAPDLSALGGLHDLRLPSYFWEKVRSAAGWALVFGLPALLLIAAGFVAWSRSRWWVAAAGGALALAVSGVGAWLTTRRWPAGGLSSLASQKLVGLAVVVVVGVAGAAMATRAGFVLRRGDVAERTVTVRRAAAVLFGLAAVTFVLALPILSTTGE